MNELIAIAVTYATAAAFQVAYGLSVMDAVIIHSRQEDRKRGARIILASPIWPVVLLIAASRGLFALIRAADLTNRKDRT